uniref:C-type lectin domain-containing protein n=1 Tax=Globodera pallida TaxID=36090 RepID=A0A183CIT8_GLOPA
MSPHTSRIAMRAAEWGQCLVPCGQGFRTRHVECVFKGQIVDDSLCMEAMRPKTNDRCVLLACAIWNAEPWRMEGTNALYRKVYWSGLHE